MRFDVDGLPGELRPIATRLNETLERIETAFEREKYLTGAMAHELYTPIAEMRSMAEVALKWPDDAEATSSLAENTSEVSARMQGIVEALLLLSRCEAGLQHVKLEEIDLLETLVCIRRSFDKRLEEKEIDIVWKVEPGIMVKTDPAMLSVVLTNLMKNAAEYTPQGGVFECRIERDEKGVAIMMDNTNANLSREDLDRLAEPFWRKDKARTGSVHSGLGMAVVSRFSELLDARLTTELLEPDLFRAVLILS